MKIDINKHGADIVRRYTEELEPMISIAKFYNVQRQTIFLILKKLGIETSKEKAGNIIVTCTMCGKESKKLRSKVRKNKHIFCNSACYYAWLDRESANRHKYIDSMTGRREARKTVSQYIELKEEYIIHHEDRNQLNNDVKNLKVFKCQGDHVRYHRGFRVFIVWDGSLIK